MFNHVFDSFRSAGSIAGGLFATLLSYFLPVRDIVHFMLILFFLDVIIGYWAARKTRGERFSSKIIWVTTIPRMVLSTLLILALFMWDNIYAQDLVSTYKSAGWFISGVLIVSIAKNARKITNWDAFFSIQQLFENKFKNNNK